MMAVATADGPMGVASANLLHAAQRAFLRSNLVLEDLPRTTPGELAQHILDPLLRRQFLQGMLVLAVAEGPPSPTKMTLVESFAAALGVDGPELTNIRLLSEKHLILFKLDSLRHSHIARVVKKSLHDDGLIATAKSLLGFRGLLEDADLAARYRALEKLPSNTFGRAFADYIQGNGFSYPGEKGGFPEGGIYHDFGHVLTGYSTEPEGEIQMAAFQAGYMKEQPIFMLLFGVITFATGINVTPLPMPKLGGIFAREDIPDLVFRAVERGAKLNIDLSDGWDHWPHVGKPLADVRASLGVEPM